MKPHELEPPDGARTRHKRVARGTAGPGGKTAGRGTKGTKARGNIRAFFEGGQMPLSRRVPKLKGFKSLDPKLYGGVNLDALAKLQATDVGPDEMRAGGLVRKRDQLVKVLGRGDIGHAVTVRAHSFSESARSKIEAAGGTVEVIQAEPHRARRRSK